ncbi:MAG: hypothetical protein OEV64_04925 [Desulfobulbaceae bacterium]|nr:hypothetical protein [Desulfobulbaceae bacterium]
MKGLILDVTTLVIGLIVLMFLHTAIRKLLVFLNVFQDDHPASELRKLPGDYESNDEGIMGNKHNDSCK